MAESSPAREVFRVGETVVERPYVGYEKIRISGVLSDSVRLEDGQVMYRTRLALNGEEGSRIAASFEIELYNIGKPPRGSASLNSSGNPTYLGEHIAALINARGHWKTLTLSQQEMAERVYWQDKDNDRDVPPNLSKDQRVAANLARSYLENKEQQRAFYTAKGAAKSAK
ncbi:MAG: hypothetical protein A3H17_03595 [Candidatus Levybacteria bacterium RIFCSPLOWO2_12_FULL_37_14]|nr:MAG: hypothetical protein US43_C0022G0009 [Candidatus Levybacteria bacterium GW2011_GWA1_37_16]KKQ40762.1 MAG: hypothetical protein US59_C0048G0009 [Candidatus Levybacteria bacterium GW2011_GWB1_37_8]OGH49825.1 MAG: hypothetical protein A3H17_03595 [Candidatus Levybacteria bacterium RIFCSPLOWO2_12_FULL_37_14]